MLTKIPIQDIINDIATKGIAIIRNCFMYTKTKELLPLLQIICNKIEVLKLEAQPNIYGLLLNISLVNARKK